MQIRRTFEDLTKMGFKRSIHGRFLEVFMGLYRIPICVILKSWSVQVIGNEPTDEKCEDMWILNLTTPVETLIAILLRDCVNCRLPDCAGRGLRVFDVGRRVEREVRDLCCHFLYSQDLENTFLYHKSDGDSVAVERYRPLERRGSVVIRHHDGTVSHQEEPRNCR